MEVDEEVAAAAAGGEDALPAPSDGHLHLDVSELRRLRFAIRQLGGLNDSAWVAANVADVAKLSSFGGDDDVDGEDKPLLSQEDFLSVGAKEAWWKSLLRSSSVLASAGVDAVDARREFGMGLWGQITGRSLKSNRDLSYKVSAKRAQLLSQLDHRPFFTYWVSVVQVLVLIAVTANSGFAPLGFGLSQRTGLVLTEYLTLEQVDVFEPANPWLGPPVRSLVAAGASFAPCMRREGGVAQRATDEAAAASYTGCCVRNDRSGCAQTKADGCSPTLSVFYGGGDEKPIVCGMDPLRCSGGSIAAAGLHWSSTNVTTWPACPGRVSEPFPRVLAPLLPPLVDDDDNRSPHLTCDVVSRPCCVGVHGRCEMRSREFCQWVGGTFHPEAQLCSQVSCMADVCGSDLMLPGPPAPPLNPPDPGWSPWQLYRLLTATFLHAGVFHLALTLAFQLTFLADLERLLGAVSTAALYFTGGAFGHLVSAAFIPMRPESGPSGAVLAVSGAIAAEAVRALPLLKHPTLAAAKIGLVACAAAASGFLPWVDNFGHVAGAAQGLLVGLAVLPRFQGENRIVPLLVAILVPSLALLVFCLTDGPLCQLCQLWSCIPLTSDFCADQRYEFGKPRYF